MTKAGDHQLPTQLPSKGSPFSKYTLDLIFSCWLMGSLKLGGICKGRIAHMTRLLFTQGYVTWVGTSPARAPLPASTELDAPLGMTQSLTGTAPVYTNSSFTCLQLAQTSDLAGEGHRCGCKQHIHGMQDLWRKRRIFAQRTQSTYRKACVL